MIAGAATASSASAEVCDASGKFCIVSPPTAASPWVAPQIVQFRLPAEATPDSSGGQWSQPGMYPGSLFPATLIAAGAPGGTSLYQATLAPSAEVSRGSNRFWPVDGAASVTLVARQSDPVCVCYHESTATFDNLPILGTIAGYNWRFKKTKRWYQVITTFTARHPIELEQLFHPSGFTKGRVDIGRIRAKRITTGIGPQRITQKLSAKFVHRYCAAFGRCGLFAESELGSPFDSQVLLWPLMRRVTVPGG